MNDNIVFVKRGSGELVPFFLVEPVTSIKSAEQKIDLMGQDVVTMVIESAEPLDINIGGTAICFGKKYTLNQLPSVTKFSERHYEYKVTLEGVQYELRDPEFLNVDATGFNTGSSFSLTGKLEVFLDVLLLNANRVFPGKWIKGTFPNTETKTITFSPGNALAALQQICQEFRQEFDIVESGATMRTLNIRKAGQVLGLVYQYGQGNGLFELSRNTRTEADIVTVLYPVGGNRNIPTGYRESKYVDLRIDGDYIEDTEAVLAFGRKERVQVFPDIYPKRIGMVTAVDGIFIFRDSSMNFDLNASTGSGTTYIIVGNPPKIHFNTGNLAGYEFPLDKYDNATKSFTIMPYEDERGMKFPNADSAAFQMAVGDQYVILDINLPQSYIESAELELRAEGQVYLDENKAPRVQYDLTFDRQYFYDLYGNVDVYNVFAIGDYVQVVDTDINIDKSSRVISMTRNLLDHYDYKLTLDDTYEINIIREIIELEKEINTIIQTGRLKDINALRMGWLTTQELLRMVYDVDGYFDGGKIKPLSIETMALVVGARSQQFVLQDVVLEPNFEGNKNVVKVSSGFLVHYTIEETPRTWTIDGTTVAIGDDSFRYIFARVSKTNDNVGNIVFDTKKWLPDEDPNFYYFLVGDLHTVIDGVRWISLTYGATSINGRWVKTGRISSFDGQTFFDLDLGVIGGRIRFRDATGSMRDLADIGADTLTFYKAAAALPPSAYTDGKFTNWFGISNPAIWPGAENAEHEGDNWYNPDSDSLFRYAGGAWVAETDPKALSAFRFAFQRVGDQTGATTTRIQIFTAEPFGYYNENDLWMSDVDGLQRSIVERVAGFNRADWVVPMNYDNTETAIDAGVLTSGLVQLAGDNYSVTAGISGRGTAPGSIRFWSGASTENMGIAPFRVNQRGELFARRRIEVEGLNSTGDAYEGQAGLCGQVDEADGDIRMYAGSNYAGRALAPFRVTKDGFATLEKALIGNWILDSSGGFFNNSGDASIIMRSNPTANSTEVMIGANVFPGSSGGLLKGGAVFRANEPNSLGSNYGAIFEASGAAFNYALTAQHGSALIEESLFNGTTTLVLNGVNNQFRFADPTSCDFIVYNAVGNNSGVCLVKEAFVGMNYRNPLRDGNRVTIFAANDSLRWRIVQTIRHATVTWFEFNGGMIVNLRYYNGAWYVESVHDNNWN